MVVSKHRYLIVHLSGGTNEHSASALIQSLREQIQEDFGTYALSLIDKLDVCEYHQNLQVGILRCNLEIYKFLCFSLLTMGAKKNLRIRLLSVSGILKKAKKEALRILKEEAKSVKYNET